MQTYDLDSDIFLHDIGLLQQCSVSDVVVVHTSTSSKLAGVDQPHCTVIDTAHCKNRAYGYAMFTHDQMWNIENSFRIPYHFNP